MENQDKPLSFYFRNKDSYKKYRNRDYYCSCCNYIMKQSSLWKHRRTNTHVFLEEYSKTPIVIRPLEDLKL